MDSPKQLELFDLGLYDCEQLVVNGYKEPQIELVQPYVGFEQLELFPQYSNEPQYEFIRLAA
jgi:hypothetical protein